MTDLIRVSAVVLRDAAGQVLTVRKRGTHRFMLPGGKPEPGESPAQCAIRECAEEIGVKLDSAQLALVGVFQAPAANEDGRQVEGTVYEHPYVEVRGSHGEIEELKWQFIDSGGETLAPLLRDKVFPALNAR